MADRALALYHRLPAPARDLVATAYGLRARWWRAGGDAPEQVAAALERDRWSPDRWAGWEADAVAVALERAAATVPFYRDHFDRRRRAGERLDVADLRVWPVVTKQDVQAAPAAFLAEGAPGRRYVEHTSGTSGLPLRLERTRRALRAWFALHEARTRRWHGVGPNDRWAMLGGQLVVPVDQDRPPWWVHNRALHQLYLSTYHLGPDSAAAYVGALRDFGPALALVYPSSAAELARLAVAAGLDAAGPRVVVTNAEPVGPAQRQAIEGLFGCPVRETYGQAEMVLAASACGSGTLHRWPEAGTVEVLADDADEPVPQGEVGRLVATGLVDRDLVLVRYDTGDRGAGSSPVACPCGRGLPGLAPVEGRSQDLLVTPGGRRVFWVNPVFYGLPLAGAQIVQRAVDDVQVRVVPAPGWSDDDAGEVRRRLGARLGSEVRVSVEPVERLERTASGKVRPVVSLAEGA